MGSGLVKSLAEARPSWWGEGKKDAVAIPSVAIDETKKKDKAGSDAKRYLPGGSSNRLLRLRLSRRTRGTCSLPHQETEGS